MQELPRIFKYLDKSWDREACLAGAVKKFAPEIDARLYKEMVQVAKQNGQSQRYILEKALEHYLHNVVPSQHLVRRGVMDAFEQSVARNRDFDRLAK